MCKHLGGRAETQLAHLWEVLTRHPGGDDVIRLPRPEDPVSSAHRDVYLMDVLKGQRALGCTDEDIYARMPEILKKQPNAENIEAISTCTSRGNLFFIRGTNGVLYAVHALYCYASYWGARVETPSGWQLVAEAAENSKHTTAYPRGATLFSR